MAGKRTLIGLGVAAAWAAMHDAHDGILDSPSKTELDAERERQAAKAERESWPEKPETRQQRRARERREMKRSSRALRASHPGGDHGR